jgi:DNA processing protein
VPVASHASSADDLRGHVRLACLPGVGARMRQLLLERFGSPEGVFAATAREIAEIPGIGRKFGAAIQQSIVDPTADEVIEVCRKQGVEILREGGHAYPPLLSRIADPPGLLFVRGSIQPCDSLAVAIVGARHATNYGRKVAWQLAGGLARAGYTIVSGLARGIDAAAHRGALDAGGRTIAVLGSGVLNVYPPEHGDLALEVAARGAVIGEALPLTEPFPGCFPQRNRIVSGLSLGVVVVEATERSGGLITARLAGEQGREVFAVPGPIDSRMSRGCHRLIRDGARLVENVDDVLEELGPLFETATAADGRTVKSPAELQLDDVERGVLDCIDSLAGGGDSRSAVDIDELVAAGSLTASQVLATIGVLEMRRILRRLPGNRVART